MTIDMDDPTGQPRSSLSRRDIFPLANTDSSMRSSDSFISQVPGEHSTSPSFHPAQLSDEAAPTQPSPMINNNLPAGAEVGARHDMVRVSDSQVIALPQVSQGSQNPYELQEMVQSRSIIHTQTDLQYQYQLQDGPAAYRRQPVGPVPSFQGVFTQTGTTAQRDLHNNASQGFGRGSVPLVRRDASGTTSGFGAETQGYSSLRQNAQRVPHPDDSPWGHDTRERRDFHSWNRIRGQRMQGYVTQDLGFRQTSTGNDFRGGDRQQNVPQVASSDTLATSHVNPDTLSEGHQQQPTIHENMASTNQQQMPARPVSVTDTDTGHAFEDGLIQAALALQLENAGTPNGPCIDDITPRRPITDNTVSATAPPRLGHQTPFLRSRRGQSVVALNGSPVRRTSQPLTIDPIQGPPPSFYPQNAPVVVTTSTVSSPILSVFEVQHQASASQSRATSVSVHSEEPHTAQGRAISSDLLVTPNYLQLARNQVVQFAPPQPETASHQMASWITPYQMPPVAAGPVSRHLSIIAPGGRKPTIEVACDPQNLPFVELLRRAQPSNSNGIVRISNIPYSTTRSEIIAFLGRNAAILEDKMEPVHIIMDRVTGKTMDAYIEFKSVYEAVKAVDRQIEVHRDGNKGGRLGNRFVTVEVSGLEQMMRTLFPKARNVVWHGMAAEIIPPGQNDRFNSGFKGFINPEELVLLVKHVQDPNRIHFAEKCPQRPFECMISTIVKYPWFMVDYITIGDRDELFQAGLEVIKCLLQRMSEDDINLNSRLLKRLTDVMFSCPGFTESQKDDVAFVCNINPYNIRPPLAPMADHWHVFKTIGPKPYVEEDVLKYYIALIREATTSMDVVTLAQRASQNVNGMPSFFGNINVQYPSNVKYWTFSQVARIEWDAIDQCLRRSLQM